MTTLVLADDHQVVRQGLRALLEAEPDLDVVGEAGQGQETMQLVERLQPDLLVLDLMMPGLNGLDITRQISQRLPGTRVIVLSVHTTEAYVLEALRNGAAGYVAKTASADELVQAVRTVAAGQRYLSSQLSERALDAYVQKARESTLDLYETLTGREREVLHLAAEGLSTPEVAARLVISPKTAATHRASLMRKLDLRNQTELVRYAIQRGIISIED
jgi:DNA-binding NarL/FixJ family response regulator